MGSSCPPVRLLRVCLCLCATILCDLAFGRVRLHVAFISERHRATAPVVDHQGLDQSVGAACGHESHADIPVPALAFLANIYIPVTFFAPPQAS